MSREFEFLRIPIEETISVYKDEIVSRQGSIDRYKAVIAPDDMVIREFFDRIFNGDLLITKEYQKHIYDRIDKVTPYEEQIDILSSQIKKIEENMNCKESLICNAKKLEEYDVVNFFERVIDSGILNFDNSRPAKVCWGDEYKSVSLIFDFHETDWDYLVCDEDEDDLFDNNLGLDGEPYYFYCTFGINDEGKLVFDEREEDSYLNGGYPGVEDDYVGFGEIDKCDYPVEIKVSDIPKCIRKVVSEYVRLENISSDKFKELEQVCAEWKQKCNLVIL